MKLWWTAREIAEARLPGLPANRANVSEWIGRTATRSPELVRTRLGRGGGSEVHVDAFPAETRAEMERRGRAGAIATLEARAIAEDTDADKRQLTTAVARHLTAGQRQVMEARASILLEIDRRVALSRRGRKQIIADLVDEVNGGRADRALIEIAQQANGKLGRTKKAKKTREGLSVRSIYDWSAARGHGGVAALAPGKRHPSPAPAWLPNFLTFYARPTKPSIEAAFAQFKLSLADPHGPPSIDQVKRALGTLSPIERAAGREGKLSLRAKLAYTARDTSELLPTTVYIADGKTFDAEVGHPLHGHPFRPELTSILDVATRRCVGWSAALDESALAVVDALRRACAECGIPAVFYTDRGPGYRNEAMDAPLTGFLGRCGITPMRALPYNSQAKGIIERFNHVWSRVSRELPTFIGRDMDKEAKQLVFKTTRREIALVGGSRILPGWDLFLEIAAAAVTAYNDAPHTALPKIRDHHTGRARHMTPNEAWAEKIKGFAPIVPTPEEVDDLFRPYVVRKVSRCLIEWLGNSYFSLDLEAYHGRDVVVGYDVRDASKVWVRAIDLVDGERQPGRLITVAVFEGNKTRYIPLSAERAAIERRAKAQRGRLEKKIDVVDQQLRPGALLEATIEAAPLVANDPQPIAAPVPVSAPRLSASGRPVFHDDIEFARWIAANPAEATPADRELLKELLTSITSQQWLRSSGVDLDALREVVRSAA